MSAPSTRAPATSPAAGRTPSPLPPITTTPPHLTAAVAAFRTRHSTKPCDAIMHCSEHFTTLETASTAAACAELHHLLTLPLSPPELSALITRQSTGHWHPRDPSPPAHIRARTDSRISTFADQPCSGLWALWDRVQSTAERDLYSDNPVHWNCDFDAWEEFLCLGNRRKSGVSKTLWLLPTVLMASFLCPEVLKRRLLGIEVWTIRKECVAALEVLREWGAGALEVENVEFEDVLEELSVRCARYTFREVFGVSAVEGRRRRREREMEMEEWEAELEVFEMRCEEEREGKRKRAETVGREGKRWKGCAVDDGDSDSDKENEAGA